MLIAARLTLARATRGSSRSRHRNDGRSHARHARRRRDSVRHGASSTSRHRDRAGLRSRRRQITVRAALGAERSWRWSPSFLRSSSGGVPANIGRCGRYCVLAWSPRISALPPTDAGRRRLSGRLRTVLVLLGMQGTVASPLLGGAGMHEDDRSEQHGDGAETDGHRRHVACPSAKRRSPASHHADNDANETEHDSRYDQPVGDDHRDDAKRCAQQSPERERVRTTSGAIRFGVHTKSGFPSVLW